ncbi:hypothetical protein O181_107854 [Austropuccinia psidii MF-1]|uniref:Uncharacterized protein n=1 Tax=Austropuccinia psidii MF-1 TaxID=1389203 RepID=A0A9Q3JTW5_9BASI|nr:hypothetical protein [Austropuccinia psidii MF-1]
MFIYYNQSVESFTRADFMPTPSDWLHVTPLPYTFITLMHESAFAPAAHYLPNLPYLHSWKVWLQHFPVFIISANYHYHTPANIAFHNAFLSYPQFTMLMLLHLHLLISSIYHAYSHARFGFCTMDLTSLQFNILILIQSSTSALAPHHHF